MGKVQVLSSRLKKSKAFKEMRKSCFFIKPSLHDEIFLRYFTDHRRLHMKLILLSNFYYIEMKLVNFETKP